MDFVLASGVSVINFTFPSHSLTGSLNSLSIASHAKSSDSLFSTLNAAGLPDTPQAHSFIQEVYSRAPRKHKRKADGSKKAEQEAKALRAQKFDYLLEDESGPSGVVELKSSSKKKSSGKGKEKEREKEKRERHTRKRESDAREWESDEEEKMRKRLRADEDQDGRHYRHDEREDYTPPREGSRVVFYDDRVSFA